MQSFLSEDRYSKEYNWLIMSKSPYLKQHKRNPVNWLEWSPEAFEKAKREDKPIFLSIGYSTCHWCHVMERESFEDPNVAELLNKYFVPIKVDREERPDVDSIYMNVCQMITGEGGWPLNVFLTPGQKPFYAGTYFPRESKYGRPGMLDILPQLHEQYENQHERISGIAEKITEGLNEYASGTGKQGIDENVVHQAYEQISEQFDEEE
ncbi:thioredoxin [Bacillus freudenreichii]|nr:thioredoxin [Bacillus freudenreichii]